MARLLAHMHLIDSRLNTLPGAYPLKDSLNRIYFLPLLKQEGVTEAQFKQAFDYYSAIPDSAGALYEAAIDLMNDSLTALQQRQAAAPTTDTAANARADSLRADSARAARQRAAGLGTQLRRQRALGKRAQGQ